MRVCLLAVTALVLVPAVLLCQTSTPAFWKYAPAEPGLLIGIDWRQASQSSLSGWAAGSFRTEASGLDFAEEIGSVLVVVEPGAGRSKFLAVATGRFNLPKLRKSAAAEGAKVTRYRGAEVFSASGTDVAVLDGLILLAGDKASVRAALDRGSAASPRAGAMWRRAAELSAQYTIWVASSSLQALGMNQPGPFADLRSFEGGITLASGLDMTFDLRTSSDESARMLAAMLQVGLQSGAGPPQAAELLKSAKVETMGPVVRLVASVDPAKLEAGVKSALAAGAPQRRGLMDWMITGAPPTQPAPAPEPRPVAFEPKVTAPPPQKKVIRIVGLEDGTREIPLPAPQR